MLKNKEILFFYYVTTFIENMRIELKSIKTIETYRSSLNDFRKYIFDVYGKKVEYVFLEFVTLEIVKSYLQNLVNSGKSINTRNIRLAAIKSYVSYAAEKDVSFSTLCTQLLKIKTKYVPPKNHNWLSKEQVEKILEMPEQTRFGIRDRFIMLFLFSTGARLNELLNIKLKDIVIESSSPYVILQGKGNKPRIVPLPENQLIQNLEYYYSLYHPYKQPDDYLLYTKSSGIKHRMSEDNVQRILKKYGNLAGITTGTLKNAHPHLLRHSYGAQLYRLGATLPEIAKLMGHSEISTTEIYAETDTEIITKAVRQTLGKQPVKAWDTLSEYEKLKVFGFIE